MGKGRCVLRHCLFYLYHIMFSFCQALVSDGTGNIIPLVSLGSNQHATAVFTNTTSVFQENTAYTVQVSCVNKGGYDSDPIVKEFHIDSTLPVSTGKIITFQDFIALNQFTNRTDSF